MLASTWILQQKSNFEAPVSLPMRTLKHLLNLTYATYRKLSNLRRGKYLILLRVIHAIFVQMIHVYHQSASMFVPS